MSDLMRFKHCPYCGFSTKQYVEDIGPDGDTDRVGLPR